MLAWPRHRSLADTEAFLAFSDAEWRRWPAGPYLVESLDGRLLGGTGLAFETAERASTGYVLARDAWGRGYASEALAAIVALADALGVQQLHSYCHVEHRASQRVLEKCGFVRAGVKTRGGRFPNLQPEPADVVSYLRSRTSRG